MACPGITILSSKNLPAGPAQPAAGGGGPPPSGPQAEVPDGGVLAINSRIKRRPKVVATRQRDALIQQLQRTAMQRMGLLIMGVCRQMPVTGM